ncbi:MAG: 1-acyl-sn-glycerol-3-phosphate acyltransferase [Candidatus Omnitrophica bacterium]|nr:1-acyl-sn-glycerol-3-phosphate acyltransferase [Candidatus Omnitrophota bacterium]
MFYTFVVFILYLICKIFFRLKIYGRENFPKSGALIVAANHVSFFDPIIVGVSAPRTLIYLARETLFKYKVFAKILNWVYTFPLKREGADLRAFRLAIGKLQEGFAVLVFPEGTRSKDGDFQEPKTGIGFLNTVSGADILPCYVKGSFEAWPRDSRFPRCRPVSVYFGKVLRFDKKDSSIHKKERYEEISKCVMAAIRELKENAD